MTLCDSDNTMLHHLKWVLPFHQQAEIRKKLVCFVDFNIIQCNNCVYFRLILDTKTVDRSVEIWQFHNEINHIVKNTIIVFFARCCEIYKD